jgi:hypothetical protein
MKSLHTKRHIEITLTTISDARGELISALAHCTPIEGVLIQQCLAKLAEANAIASETLNALEANE